MERTTQIQTPQGPATLADIADPYCLFRGWRDGEVMQPHMVWSGATLDQAQAESDRIGGGYVVRTADGASLLAGEWVTE